MTRQEPPVITQRTAIMSCGPQERGRWASAKTHPRSYGGKDLDKRKKMGGRTKSQRTRRNSKLVRKTAKERGTYQARGKISPCGIEKEEKKRGKMELKFTGGTKRFPKKSPRKERIKKTAFGRGGQVDGQKKKVKGKDSRVDASRTSHKKSLATDKGQRQTLTANFKNEKPTPENGT